MTDRWCLVSAQSRQLTISSSDLSEIEMVLGVYLCNCYSCHLAIKNKAYMNINDQVVRPEPESKPNATRVARSASSLADVGSATVNKFIVTDPMLKQKPRQ